MKSVFQSRRLISLALVGGVGPAVLPLDSLESLEELICSGVRKLKRIILNPTIFLRSLELSHLKEFESIGPIDSITRELRVVELNRVPRIGIDWLQQAKHVECIALRLGEIPSINFLSGLTQLQVLDLWGSKVKDRDLSFRDSLKGELDRELWGRFGRNAKTRG